MMINSSGSKGQLPVVGSISNINSKPVGLLGQQNLIHIGDSEVKMNFAKMGSSILSGSNIKNSEHKNRAVSNYNTETARLRAQEDSSRKKKAIENGPVKATQIVMADQKKSSIVSISGSKEKNVKELSRA